MNVYIIFNPHTEQIEHVFLYKYDAEIMLESFGKTDRIIETHEVIE